MSEPGKNKRFKLSLAKKITIWILIISGVFTILTSGFQLYMDFLSGKHEIEKSLFIIESSHIKSLNNAVWNMDRFNINTQMEGILSLPDISYLHLHGNDFDDFLHGNIPEPHLQIKREYTLVHKDHPKQEAIKIGELTVFASLENLYTALKGKIFIIIISQAVKTSFVSFFIIFLVYSLITRHLGQITRYLENLDVDDNTSPLTIDKSKSFINFGKNDELDLLVSKINFMQNELGLSFKKLKQANEGLNIEIAERIKVEEELIKSENRFRAAFDSAGDCVLIWDRDYNYIFANQAAIDHVGTTPDKVIGKNIRDGLAHVPDFMRLWMRRIDRVFETGKMLHVQDETLMQNCLYYTDSILTPVSGYDKNVDAVCVVYRDITHLKKTEAALKDLTENLEAKIEERTGQLQEANKKIEAGLNLLRERSITLEKTMEKAKAANKAKSEFLARMSHEIRTPMNGIIGLTNLVLKSNLTSQQENYLKKVCESSNHLLHIINDILDFSRIEDGKLEIDSRDFKLNSLINKAADIIEEKSSEKKIEFVYIIDRDVPLSLKGDPVRLKQILINLMDNAVKFTETGKIILKIRLADKLIIDYPKPDKPKDDKQAPENQVELIFSIQDTGIGISPEKIENIFNPFTQADGSVTRKYGGTGLGLSICRHLVNLMQGKIWVNSVKGDGSSFYFSLPFMRQPEENQHFQPALKSAGAQNMREDQIEKQETESINLDCIRGARILLVEDNEINRDVAIALLKTFGLDFDIAKNGQEAVENLRAGADAPANLYEAVLMDIEMPVMDGYKATRIIRDIPQCKDLPVIAMTAHAMTGDREKCLDAGMNDYISKPVNEKHLLRVLCKWIKPGKREIKNNRDEQKKTLPKLPHGFPPVMPGINLEEIVTKYRCKENILKKMLLSFLEKYENAADDLEYLMENNKINDAQKLVHSIKGVAGHLCAHELFLVSQELNAALKHKKNEEIPVLKEKFEQNLITLTNSLNNLNLKNMPDHEKDS